MSLLHEIARPVRFALELGEFIRYRGPVHRFINASYRSSGSWGALGSVQAHEYPLLKKLCAEASAHPGPIVEIGTLFGFATTQIALWKDPSKQIITVDNYSWNPCGLPPEAHFQLTSRVLEYLSKTGQLRQLRMEKEEFFRTYAEGAPALVFLDADHSYEETRKDIEWAKRAGARIICGHDYSEECPGVKRAVNDFGGPLQLLGSVWSLGALSS